MSNTHPPLGRIDCLLVDPDNDCLPEVGRVRPRMAPLAQQVLTTVGRVASRI
ncbi:hypothetical protein RA280_33520 [Cupriavidus sp. CV2]|uniref:hypothetical protein n=1 Tax=Cupriavidus ulmosensis TaxID=3065913 RepID=UPI00296AF387|nr:hypothetical protein [Cupriavidus sp. CV2]MDW3686576.1 hypothetical protein [Cupriavidus sp. CV2]